MSETYEEYVKHCEEANNALTTTRKKEGEEIIAKYGSLPSPISREQWELMCNK